MTRLGDIIKTKRENMGLSLREFAEKCNMSHSYIKNLEDGDPRTGRDIIPTLNSLEKLAPVLDMSIENLLKQIGYIQSENKGYKRSRYRLIRNKKRYMHLSSKMPGSFLYTKIKSSSKENSKKDTLYRSTLIMEGVPSYLDLSEDLQEFVLNPSNVEYIRLAKELRDKNIKVKFIRDTLFENN